MFASLLRLATAICLANHALVVALDKLWQAKYQECYNTDQDRAKDDVEEREYKERCFTAQ